MLPAVLLALGMLSACAARPAVDPASSSSDGPGGMSPMENDLTVEFDRGDGSAVQRWTLICDAGQGQGTHPAPEEACDHLSGMAEPFAPIPDDMVCSQQYGGPQTAHVTGRWAGRSVDIDLSRVDGCRIAQWDGLGPLLPD